VAVHAYRDMPHQRYFKAVEETALALGGRPHWGKLHTLDADQLAERYPEWEAFQQARARLDPDGVFANEYLDRVLGPVGAVASPQRAE
jgi:L-gulonolactone oxidase